MKTRHKSLICFSLLLCKKCEVRDCLPQSTGEQQQPFPATWEAVTLVLGPGSVERVRGSSLRPQDPFTLNYNSHPVSRLYAGRSLPLGCYSRYCQPTAQQRACSFFHVHFILSCSFSATCLHRKSLRESQTKQEVICSQIKGTRGMKMGRIRKRRWLTRPRS